MCLSGEWQLLHQNISLDAGEGVGPEEAKKSVEEHTRWNDDDKQQEYNSNDEAHSHFHVLIPHGLPDAVCSTSEALCGYSEVIGLVLEGVQAFSTL